MKSIHNSLLLALTIGLSTRSTFATADGNMKFINNVGQKSKVSLNGVSAVGIPIPKEGLTMSYSLIHKLCWFSANALPATE